MKEGSVMKKYSSESGKSHDRTVFLSHDDPTRPLALGSAIYWGKKGRREKDDKASISVQDITRVVPGKGSSETFTKGDAAQANDADAFTIFYKVQTKEKSACFSAATKKDRDVVIQALIQLSQKATKLKSDAVASAA